MDEKETYKEPHSRTFTNSQRGGRNPRRGQGRHWGYRRDQQSPSAPPSDFANLVSDESCVDASLPSAPPQDKVDGLQKLRGKHHHYNRHKQSDSFPNVNAGEFNGQPGDFQEGKADRSEKHRGKHYHYHRHQNDGFPNVNAAEFEVFAKDLTESTGDAESRENLTEKHRGKHRYNRHRHNDGFPNVNAAEFEGDAENKPPDKLEAKEDRSQKHHGKHRHSRHRENDGFPNVNAAEFEGGAENKPPDKLEAKEDNSQKHHGKHRHRRHRQNDGFPNVNAPEFEGCAKDLTESVGDRENRPPDPREQRRPYRFHGAYNPRKQWHRERYSRDGGAYREHSNDHLEEFSEKPLSADSKLGDDESVDQDHKPNNENSLQFRSYQSSGYRGYAVSDNPSFSRQDCRSQAPRSYSSYQRRDWGREGQFRQLEDSAEPQHGDDSSATQEHQRNYKQGYKSSRAYWKDNKENDGRSTDFRGHRDYHKHGDEYRGNSAQKSHRKGFRRNQEDSENKENCDDDDVTQKERLTEQLFKGDCECIVCCERVRSRDAIWCCRSCYHIFHLSCIRKWARSPTATAGENGWRCPTCQSVTTQVPSQYYCFCGKVRDPERNRHDTPHSCGNTCDRERPPEKNCKHLCTLLCHPGPCPPCLASVYKSCPCGRVKMQVLCSRTASLACGEPCKKMLSCSTHVCPELCHDGNCPPCSETVTRICYCSKVSQSEACTAESNLNPNFGCGQPCGRLLACGQHECLSECHPDDCPPCPTLPESILTCPCGKTPLFDLCGEHVRQKCTDPIPTCVAVCGKLLSCGPNEERHTCASRCHHGPCPECPLRTALKCCCGSSTKEVPCPELSALGILRCEKRCSKKRQCGRHKCVNNCCVDLDHLCDLVCNQKLSCGLHTCQETCHNGNCRACWNVSFEELTCRCGAAVIYPPIPCGTNPPDCREKCQRDHPCDHPIFHNCHSDENCPPCTALTSKRCYGGHELRKTIPCYQEGFSCGLSCSKPLPCGQHQCLLKCHEGDCQKECLQPCPKIRDDCAHPCAASCHQDASCPENVPCKANVTMTCICGTRSERLACGDNSKSFQKMSASLLAAKMQDIQSGNSVDISDILGSGKKAKSHRLECNDDCALVDRNRRLALALQIRNPDLAGKPGPPNYSEFLKDEARKSPQFVDSIGDKLTELVQLAKQSKQKSRSHSFQPMNRDQRRVVHELATFFGCETESYDQEPKRNVVVTAFRDKSYLPSVSVVAVIQREMGQRKAPNPAVLNATVKAPETTQAKAIDYFDFSSADA